MNWSKDMQTPQIQPHNTKIAAVVYPPAAIETRTAVETIDKQIWLQNLWRDPRLTSATKERGMSISWFTDESGWGHPNLKDIERALGNTRIGRTSGYISKLQEAGWIEIGLGNSYSWMPSNNYQLRFPDGYSIINYGYQGKSPQQM